MSKKSRFKKQKYQEQTVQETPVHEKKEPSKKFSIRRFYFDNLTHFLYATILLIILAVAYIGYTTYTTGDFVKKGVSLKGGISVTLMTGEEISLAQFEEFVKREFPKADYSVITYSASGKQQGLILEISGAEIKDLISKISAEYGLNEGDYTLEETGAVIGESFFSQTIKAMLVAFLLMGMVVFIYFGDSITSKIMVTITTLVLVGLIFGGLNTITLIIAILLGIVLAYFFLSKSIPSFAVILAGASTIILTLAVFNLLDMRLTTGGIAAFLMLIGYSVDTDILLTTRVIKNQDKKDFEENVISSIKTGLTMTICAIAATLTAYFFTQSDMLKQIMIILFIGLCFDILNTWVQNVAVIKLYLDHHKDNK